MVRVFLLPLTLSAAARMCAQSGQLAPIDLIVETRFHRAAPGGMGGTKAAGNYSPVSSHDPRLFQPLCALPCHQCCSSPSHAHAAAQLLLLITEGLRAGPPPDTT